MTESSTPDPGPGAPGGGPGVRPPVQPVQVDTRRIVAAGTAIWFAAFVVLLPFYGWLGRHDHRIWLWTALAGWLLGLVGLVLVRKHRDEGRTR